MRSLKQLAKKKKLRLSQKPPTPLVLSWRSLMAELPGMFLAYETLPSVNMRGAWYMHEGRIKKERELGALIAMKLVSFFPMACIFTRYGSTLLDDDNLRPCFKAIRDGIAQRLGVRDGPTGPIKWEYKQEKTGLGCYGIRVEFNEQVPDHG